MDDLIVCGLTACTPGSAPGPTLGNEYGKPLLSYPFSVEELIIPNSVAVFTIYNKAYGDFIFWLLNSVCSTAWTALWHDHRVTLAYPLDVPRESQIRVTREKMSFPANFGFFAGKWSRYSCQNFI